MKEERKMKWRIVSGLVLLALLLGLVYLGPYRFYIVISGSMEPKILTGSLILVDQSCTEPETGDVITFQQRDTVVTHRVVRRLSEGSDTIGYETKGDANKRKDDGIVLPGQVIGTCIWSIPYLGYVCSWFRTKQGIVVICLLAVEWMLLRTFLARWRQKMSNADTSLTAEDKENEI